MRRTARGIYNIHVGIRKFLLSHTKCPKIYRKYVMHLLKYTANLYLSSYSTDLRSILGHSVNKANQDGGKSHSVLSRVGLKNWDPVENCKYTRLCRRSARAPRGRSRRRGSCPRCSPLPRGLQPQVFSNWELLSLFLFSISNI